jgi:REP element-mobilizing transposase RayT
MPQSLINNNVHLVYSTRDRQRFISTQMQPKLWAYVAGVVKNIGGNPIAIGGMDDHIHILAEIPATVDIAKAVNAFKVNSSKWMKDSVPKFAWQRGYAAFSVSASNVSAVKKYVLTQPEHHKKRDFQTEYIALLKKHGVQYDERYVFD